MNMSKSNRVSPGPDSFQLTIPNHERPTGWAAKGDDQPVVKTTNRIDYTADTLRRRRPKSVNFGTEDYEKYVEKRVFNKRHAWTPFLWQRKRDKRLMGNLNPTRGWKGWKFRQRMRWNSIKITWREWSASLEIWRHSLKRIEGYQGTGVVSYFVFLKFLLFLNTFIFLVVFFGVVFFQVGFKSMDFNKDITGYDNNSESVGFILSENCSSYYTTNTSSGFQLALDFLQGTGWMETTAFFYGYYGNTHVAIPGGKYNMPLGYFLTAAIVLLASLVVMIHHTFSKYMNTAVISEQNLKSRFFASVFVDWDYRVNGEQPVALLQKNFYNRLFSELEELRHELEMKNSSSLSRCCLWFVRIIVNFFIVCLLVAAAVAIYFAQTFSSKFTTSSESKDYDMIVVLLVEFLPSIVIAVFNGVFPVIFVIVVKAENYKPATVITVTILRIVFVRLAALIVVTATIYAEITCADHDLCFVGKGSCPRIQCWETYFGQQIYKFMVTEFLCDVFLTLLYELPRKLLTTKCDCSIGKKIGPAQFDIPINVLDLVYAQALNWLGFFFAPLLPALTIVRLVALFYLRKLSALYNTIPPEKPYQAARSNAFFMVTLLVTFFMVSVPVGYVLVELRPSPMCGPFRIYSYPTDIVDIQIDLAENWLKTIWTIITSSAFIAVVILLLSMALYYCSALKSANKRIIKRLKTQRLQDDKDKQYLIVQLSKYTHEGKTNGDLNDHGMSKPPTSIQNSIYTAPTKDEKNTQSVYQANKQPTNQNQPITHLPTNQSSSDIIGKQAEHKTNMNISHIPEKTGSPKGLVIQNIDDYPQTEW